MKSFLIESIEELSKDDPTGQKKAFELGKIIGAKEAYLEAVKALSYMSLGFSANARALDGIIKLLEKKNES